MNDVGSPLTLRRWRDAHGAADGYGRRAGLLAAAAAVLAILGPFGTFSDFGFFGRLAYWGGLVFCGALAFEALIRLAFSLPALAARHWSAPAAFAVLTTAAAQTAAVWAVEQAVRPSLRLSLAELYAYVLLVTILVSAAPIWRELRARGLLDSPPAPSVPRTAAEPGRPPFFDRIPPHLTGDLLALEMEDHYLRVHTESGSDLILMRLRDAVAELAGADGVQAHRSFWVAAAAVADVERTPDGRATLVLRNGLRVPVSRSRMAAVRGAGWLRGGSQAGRKPLKPQD